MSGNEDPEGVGDSREKHVTVVTASGERTDHGEVYLRHATDAFLVSPAAGFPPEETTRYAKSDLRRVEITQHHAGCFIATATAGEGQALDALRRFRDDAMRRTPVGRALVALYYRVSPPVAAVLERHPQSRTARAVRWLVERCGALSRRRERSESDAVRLLLSAALVALYVVGMAVAVVGSAALRASER